MTVVLKYLLHEDFTRYEIDLKPTMACICTAQHCIVPKVRSSGGGRGGALRCSSRFVGGGARRRPLYGGGQLALWAPPRRPQRKRARTRLKIYFLQHVKAPSVVGIFSQFGGGHRQSDNKTSSDKTSPNMLRYVSLNTGSSSSAKA